VHALWRQNRGREPAGVACAAGCFSCLDAAVATVWLDASDADAAIAAQICRLGKLGLRLYFELYALSDLSLLR